MLERDSLKILDEALDLLEQGFAAMSEFKAAPIRPSVLLAGTLFLVACAGQVGPVAQQVPQAELQAIQAATQAYDAKDYKTAFDGYLPWAEKGEDLIEYRIAYMYQLGLGVQKDQDQARHWYEKAASGGDVEAAIELGYEYMVPDSGAPDYGQALRWFTFASDRGDIDADLDLSILYEHGFGVAKDHDQALHWLDEFVARQKIKGDTIQYRFTKFTSGDNTGGFGVALGWVLKQASDHRVVARCDCRMTGLTFHYQDGWAKDVAITTPSGDPAIDAAAVDFLQKTLLPPVLPSLSHQDTFTVYIDT